MGPYKLVSALVSNPRNFNNVQTQSGVNSEEYCVKMLYNFFCIWFHLLMLHVAL